MTRIMKLRWHMVQPVRETKGFWHVQKFCSLTWAYSNYHDAHANIEWWDSPNTLMIWKWLTWFLGLSSSSSESYNIASLNFFETWILMSSETNPRAHWGITSPKSDNLINNVDSKQFPSRGIFPLQQRELSVGVHVVLLSSGWKIQGLVRYMYWSKIWAYTSIQPEDFSQKLPPNWEWFGVTVQLTSGTFCAPTGKRTWLAAGVKFCKRNPVFLKLFRTI